MLARSVEGEEVTPTFVDAVELPDGYAMSVTGSYVLKTEGKLIYLQSGNVITPERSGVKFRALPIGTVLTITL